MKILLTLAFVLFSSAIASAQTEQAPILEKQFSYKSWKYKTVRDNSEIKLRDFARDKKLVLVVYFAPWCPNWRNEAPFAEKMYEKYKANGFDVVGVGEYDTVDAMKLDLDKKKILFPVVYESKSRDDKQKTLHYEYRKQTGDTRNWGSPYNIFLIPANFNKKGDVLTEKTYVVNGELIEKDAEAFIREKLGLPAEETKTTAMEKNSNETCDPSKNATTLKKPE